MKDKIQTIYIDDEGFTLDVAMQRLANETRARIEAERLLEDKSKRLYATNKALEKVAENLEGQRQQLNTILNHTVAGIFLVNENLKVVQSNKAGNEMLKLSPDDLLDLSVKSLFDRGDAVTRLVRLKMKAADGEVSIECEAHKKGENFPVECGISPILRPDGRKWTVWIMSDITRRKREEARRIALERELNQAQKMESLGTLASGVAHEINTPIQYVGNNLRFIMEGFEDIFGILKLVEQGASPEAVKEASEQADIEFLNDELPDAIEQSLKGLEQVGGIVKAIKEFSHPGSDVTSEVNINEAISTTLTMSRNQWKYVADVELNLAEDIPLVPCSAGDLNQVLVNLLVNAADAIAENNKDERGVIRIATYELAGWVSIEIEDTGCGMSPEVLERIFDPFFTTKDVGKGTGQGLAITYNIIKQKHSGDILCQSVPGEGSCFTLRLPITPDAIGSSSTMEASLASTVHGV